MDNVPQPPDMQDQELTGMAVVTQKAFAILVAPKNGFAAAAAIQDVKIAPDTGLSTCAPCAGSLIAHC